MIGRPAHLLRRLVTSLSRREPRPGDIEGVRAVLSSAEFDLWSTMRGEDRRHSIEVLHRFDRRAAGAPREVRAGVLLHDIGKVECGLGVMGRVLATLVGPRGTRFAAYHDHERLGAALLGRAGSAGATVDLVGGRGPFVAVLREADDV